jgi:hypothetical protein
MWARTWTGTGAVGLLTGAIVLSLGGPATAADGGHGLGRMGPSTARTTTVSPSSGPDFEMPFVCGQRWIGSSRSSHSPSAYTIDWNTSNDLGRPALASAPGVVTKAVTLTGSYGRYVVVDHGRGFSTLYAHLNQIVATVGTYLDQGDLVGYVGGSGNVTGPHLHFEERKDGAYFPPYVHRTTFRMGSTGTSALCGDRPLLGDWTGDGRTDLGVFRSSSTANLFYQRKGTATTYVTWGRPGDVPVTGDFDGDGKTEVATRSLGKPTFVQRAASGATRASINYGVPSDVPFTGDWDGNGTSDLAVYRASSRLFCLRRPDGTTTSFIFGATGDRPISGDWNGDGRTDVGTFSPATGYWSLRVPSGSSYVVQKIGYGQSTDVPITGDWDGDGLTELGVWRPSTAQFIMRARTKVVGRYQNQVVVFGNKR